MITAKGQRGIGVRAAIQQVSASVLALYMRKPPHRTRLDFLWRPSNASTRTPDAGVATVGALTRARCYRVQQVACDASLWRRTPAFLRLAISRAHRVTVARALTCYDIGLSWLGHWLHSWLWPLVLLCKAHCITAFVALPPPLKALNSPSIHVFGELLSLPSVQAVGLGFKRCGAMRVASWRRQFALTDTLDAL